MSAHEGKFPAMPYPQLQCEDWPCAQDDHSEYTVERNGVILYRGHSYHVARLIDNTMAYRLVEGEEDAQDES